MITILDDIFTKIRFSDLNITNVESYKIDFKNGNLVDYSKEGRRKTLLHLVISGKRIYETKDKIFTVEAGTLIFIPEGAKYKTTSQTVNNELCSGIGITFDMNINFNPSELEIYYKEKVCENAKVLDLFERTYRIYKKSPLEILELKTAVYNLFSHLATSSTSNSTEYSLIKPAIEYINEHYTENLPITRYAEKSNLSESYFRKKFVDYMGLSPVEYRNQLRFTEAKRMYQKGFSTGQIAEHLGFCDTAYFLKLYKRKVGRTLKEDAKII